MTLVEQLDQLIADHGEKIGQHVADLRQEGADGDIAAVMAMLVLIYDMNLACFRVIAQALDARLP